MRAAFPDVVEKGRVCGGVYATSPGDRCGAFHLKAPTGVRLSLLASDGGGWAACGFPPPAFEHVSVSLEDRCPTWEEMCWLKGLFWGPDECVVQYHPPAAGYVNCHQFCLHLWMPVGFELPLPPASAVGPKGGVR